MNGGVFVTREALIELLEATLEEVKGNASFEGRIQYTCMVDDCPKGHFAVRAFIRTGNDMGQGGAMVVAGDIVIDAPPPTEPEEWEDTPDEWSDAIRDAYPTRSGSHMQYGEAMKMVGNRQSKGALVALVNWLLVRIAKLEARLRVIPCLVRDIDKMRDKDEIIAIARGETPPPTDEQLEMRGLNPNER